MESYVHVIFPRRTSLAEIFITGAVVYQSQELIWFITARSRYSQWPLGSSVGTVKLPSLRTYFFVAINFELLFV